MCDFYIFILFFNFKNMYYLATESRLWYCYMLFIIISESPYLLHLFHVSCCLIILKYEWKWTNDFSINVTWMFNFEFNIILSYILKNISIKVSKHTVTIMEVLIKIMTITVDLEFNYSGGYSRYNFPRTGIIYQIRI